jgi:ABC-type amino acid transport system permease subunit
LVGVAILPAYSAISAYGIFLRIAQYGFTRDRLWATSIWFILSCFVIGYFIGIGKLRDNWLIVQSKVNVIMGLVLLAFVLLVNSPVLNFKLISSNSQMARYYNGEVALEDLDIYYFSNNLGAPSYLAMQQLKTDITQSHPEIVASINKQYRYGEKRTQRRNQRSQPTAEQEVDITYWPSQDAFNADLIAQ